MLTFPETKVLELSNGRRLSFAIYGDPDGVPVYYMHGFYGSRLEAMLAAEAAVNMGIKLIAADRPGVGESSSEPGRSLQSWARNIGELADHFGHDRIHLLGVSGGGPFALACSVILSERIAGVSLCGSLAPLNDNRLIPFKFRVALWAQRHLHIGLAAGNYLLYFAAKKAPGMLLKLIGAHLSPSDRNILKNSETRAVLTASLREASEQGPLYGEQELTIFGSDWDIPFRDITAPTIIWHGEQDKVVPPEMALQLHAKLDHSEVHVVADEGHFSLPVLHTERIFQSLLSL